MGFGFGLGCNQSSCCKKCPKCDPLCTCVNTYNPFTGADIGQSWAGLDIIAGITVASQCPSTTGDVFLTQVGYDPTSITITGYQPGSTICYSGVGCISTDADQPFCTGYSNNLPWSCQPIPIFPYGMCVGNDSGNNVVTTFNIATYSPIQPTTSYGYVDGILCPYNTCACSFDVCSSGGHVCLQAAHCPTRLNYRWDAYYANLAGSDPPIAYVSGVCDYLDNSADNPLSPCTACPPSNGNSAGQCSVWLYSPVDLQWDKNANRFLAANRNQKTYITTNRANPYDSYTNAWLYPNGSIFTWDNILFTLDCVTQEINPCQDNNVQLTYTNHGQGGWGDWQTCPDTCGCSEGTIFSKYPTGPATLNFSQTLSFDCNGVIHNQAFTANFTLPLDLSTGPPRCCANGPSYQNVCQSTTQTMPVCVTEWAVGFGFVANAGFGNVTLQSVACDVPGSKNGSVIMQTPGTSNFGDPFTSAIVNGITWSPWDCTNFGNGARTACFDSNLNFTGWDDAGTNCGCGNTLNCTYYYANVNSVGYASLSCYGTIDLCNNVIMLTIYNGSTQVGTVNV